MYGVPGQQTRFTTLQCGTCAGEEDAGARLLPWERRQPATDAAAQLVTLPTLQALPAAQHPEANVYLDSPIDGWTYRVRVEDVVTILHWQSSAPCTGRMRLKVCAPWKRLFTGRSSPTWTFAGDEPLCQPGRLRAGPVRSGPGAAVLGRHGPAWQLTRNDAGVQQIRRQPYFFTLFSCALKLINCSEWFNRLLAMAASGLASFLCELAR